MLFTRDLPRGLVARQRETTGKVGSFAYSRIRASACQHTLKWATAYWAYLSVPARAATSQSDHPGQASWEMTISTNTNGQWSRRGRRRGGWAHLRDGLRKGALTGQGRPSRA
eukprot:5802058-Pleurochrysis_carterae.AAC.1